MLSKFKPTVNATTLISDLQQVEKTVSKALEYFNSTQHITLYYEDLVKNHTVRIMFSLWSIHEFYCFLVGALLSSFIFFGRHHIYDFHLKLLTLIEHLHTIQLSDDVSSSFCLLIAENRRSSRVSGVATYGPN